MIHYIHTHTHDTLNTYTHTLFTTHIRTHMIHMIHYTHTQTHTNIRIHICAYKTHTLTHSTRNESTRVNTKMEKIHLLSFPHSSCFMNKAKPSNPLESMGRFEKIETDFGTSSYVNAALPKSGVNFINVLRTTFTLVDPKSVKRY